MKDFSITVWIHPVELYGKSVPKIMKDFSIMVWTHPVEFKQSLEFEQVDMIVINQENTLCATIYS